jgi:restriction endonuclease S subunit
MFKVTRGYVLAATLTEEKKSEEMKYPVYSSQTKDNGLMGYYKDYLYEDAITWTTDGANAGTVNFRAGKFYCTNVAMSREYMKQVNQCWYQIYQIVKENCSVEFGGRSPQDDLMERLLSARKGK